MADVLRSLWKFCRQTTAGSTDAKSRRKSAATAGVIRGRCGGFTGTSQITPRRFISIIYSHTPFRLRIQLDELAAGAFSARCAPCVSAALFTSSTASPHRTTRDPRVHYRKSQNSPLDRPTLGGFNTGLFKDFSYAAILCG